MKVFISFSVYIATQVEQISAKMKTIDIDSFSSETQTVGKQGLLEIIWEILSPTLHWLHVYWFMVVGTSAHKSV